MRLTNCCRSRGSQAARTAKSEVASKHRVLQSCRDVRNPRDGGVNPHWNLFRSTKDVKETQRYEELKQNAVFAAMEAAVQDAEDIEMLQWRMRQQKQVAGRSWRSICAGIRAAALRILRQRRKTTKRKEKKAAKRPCDVTKSTW